MVAARAVEVVVNVPARSSEVAAAQVRCCSGGEGDGASVAYSAPLDRFRVRNFGGVLAATVNLISCAPAPTILLWR